MLSSNLHCQTMDQTHLCPHLKTKVIQGDFAITIKLLNPPMTQLNCGVFDNDCGICKENTKVLKPFSRSSYWTIIIMFHRSIYNLWFDSCQIATVVQLYFAKRYDLCWCKMQDDEITRHCNQGHWPLFLDNGRHTLRILQGNIAWYELSCLFDCTDSIFQSKTRIWDNKALQ